MLRTVLEFILLLLLIYFIIIFYFFILMNILLFPLKSKVKDRAVSLITQVTSSYLQILLFT